MYPMSDRFRAALKGPHKPVAKCEVYNGKVYLATIPVTDGDVNIDIDAANMRRANVTLNAEDFVPRDAADLLHTKSGNELHLFRGIEFSTIEKVNGRFVERKEQEYMPLGVFGLEDVDVADGGDKFSISVKIFDRSKEIQRRRFTDLYYIPKNTNYGIAIRELLNSRMPGLTYNFSEVNHLTPTLVFGEGGWSGGGDPWEKAQEMATNIGMRLFFDKLGAVKLIPEPDPKQSLVSWEYVEGPESTLLHATRGISKEGVFNHVVVIGNHSGLLAPIRADAKDEDPNSPTNIADYGDVPTFHQSTMIFTQSQGQDVADAQLLKHLGTPENIRFIGMVNPAHEAGDIVRIRRERAGIDSVHVLDKINIPLLYSGPANGSARERRV